MICSTIIPTIGRATLERSVRSAVEQELLPDQHQVIIVNNSGGPLKAAEWMQLPKVSIIHTNHYPATIASNIGVSAAIGTYCNILHDDDYLLPGALTTLIGLAQRTGSCWVYGAYDRIDDDGVYLSTDTPRVQGNILALLLAGECLHFGPSLFHRDTFLRVGGLDPAFDIVDDREIEARMALEGSFAGTERLVARLRVGRQGSASDWSGISREYRAFREKLLSMPGVRARARQSIQDDDFLRGRVCRTYLFSAVLNVMHGEIGKGLVRLYDCMLLAGTKVQNQSFWRGLQYHTRS